MLKYDNKVIMFKRGVYMKRTHIKFVFSMCFTLTILLSIGLFARAAIINPHAYAIQRINAIYYGGYFYNPYGQIDLNSRYSSNTHHEFITNEMWNVFSTSDGGRWIEVGEVDGVLNGNYWAGHFLAIQDDVGYREYAIGSNFSSTGHSFEIQKIGYNKWGVYVDFNKVMDFSIPYSKVSYMDIGIETNTTTASFTNGMYNSAIQYLNSGSTWTKATSATREDYNPFNWISTYNSSTNRITYNQ